MTDYRLQYFTTFFLVFLMMTALYGNSPPKTIAIFTFDVPTLPTWDPDSIKSGITGSEEAVIYISQKLADKGYKVLVFGKPPQNSPYSKETSNPRYVPFNFLIPSKFDIAIAWRMPGAATQLKNIAHKVYLWPHDTIYQTIPLNEINAFTDVLWLSQWQRAQWVAVNPGFVKFQNIYGNGVNLDQFAPIQERENPYSCIYGSNYGRGLAILLQIWPRIKEQFPQATLDIYYGWKHWGLLSNEQEAIMREQVKNLENSGVKEHGLVGHEELNQAYAKASFWTYPCIMPECFAITALRAQASGAVPVVIQRTALQETVRSGYKCAEPKDYLQTLIQAMQEAPTITREQRQQMRTFVGNEFTWDKIADKWIKTFEQ